MLGCRENRHITADLREDRDCGHGILVHTGYSTDKIQTTGKGLYKIKDFLFNTVLMSFKLINVVEAFTQLNSLFRRDGTIDCVLNHINRSLAAFVNERCNIEMFAGMCEDVFGSVCQRTA